MRPATLFCDRVRALRALGYTPRQLRFLRLVLRCGGVCVPRQYARHAGIASGGRRCLGFFARLVRRGHAARLPCGHNRAHVYHVHGRALEAAFGEDANRYRRAMSPALVVVRLMRLDAALMTPDAVAYRALTDADLRGGWRRLEPAAGPVDGPDPTPATGPRRLPLIHPVGIDRGGATVFVCLVTEASPDRFRQALQGLLAHLATAQAWALFVVFTAPLARLRRTYEAMVRDELESPLTDDDVQGLWRLFLRRREGAERRSLPPLPGVAAAGHHLFTRPRFGALYRHWMAAGDAAFEPLRSTAAVEAIADGRGRVAWLTLAHDYDHLVPVVDGLRATGAGSAFADGLDPAEGLVGGQLEFREFGRGQRPHPRLERRAGNGAHLKREGHGLGGQSGV